MTQDEVRGLLEGGATTTVVVTHDVAEAGLLGDRIALLRDGRPDEHVLSREKERLALCINSFSTPAGGRRPKCGG